MYFLENQTKEIGRNRQSPFLFSARLLLPNSVFMRSLEKGKIPELWACTYLILFFMPPFLLFSFSLMDGAHLLHEPYYYQITFSGNTTYAFSGTSCNKSLKHDLRFSKGLVSVHALFLGEVETCCV